MRCQGVFVMGGVIDPDYRGDVMAILPISNRMWKLEVNQKICLLVVVPSPEVSLTEKATLPATERREGWFGSTGK